MVLSVFARARPRGGQRLRFPARGRPGRASLAYSARRQMPWAAGLFAGPAQAAGWLELCCSALAVCRLALSC
eukprot:3782918-Pleurochrysis_carterae.AAC.1